ncbi:MAG: methionine gamma-lyase family protein [Acetobacteraceae bacterium]|nr:methionine gamma-lyase family protein [Acetobacteraceae bacterium]
MDAPGLDLDPDLCALADAAEAEVAPVWRLIDAVEAHNQARVVDAFRRARVGQECLGHSAGYGYGDVGRDRLEQAFALALGAEAAMVRPQIATGTQALVLALAACLEAGGELVSATGPVYETLRPALGLEPGAARPLLRQTAFRQVDLTPRGAIDLERLEAAVGPETRAVWFQRSCGYEWRPSLSVSEIGRAVAAVKAKNPETVCLVDNCYGEFVEAQEPTAVGADLIAGSLLKNPGGGLASSGGYVAGRADLVERAAERLIAPGQGRGVGPLLGEGRWLFHGLFLAPHVVAEALRGAVLAARLLEGLGLEVLPRWQEPRTDIVQAVRLGSPEAVLAFCRGLQAAGPVEAEARPEPARLPGYRTPVIMAGGTFVPGSSIELSADAPMRPPWAVYLQGGLTRQHVRLGVLLGVQELRRSGLLRSQAAGPPPSPA